MKRKKRNGKRVALLMGACCLALTVVTALSAVLSYPKYVESKFEALIDGLRSQGRVVVAGSSCLGEPSDRVQLLPIFKSWSTGRYPWPLDSHGPLEREYIFNAYWHGYWFNYCKHLKVGERDLLAYWSVRESRWHVGFELPKNGENGWVCLSHACGPEYHRLPPSRLRPDAKLSRGK